MSNYGPTIKLARVFEKTSAKGNTYFTGRLAGAKIAIMKSKDVADDGGAIWEIVLSQASTGNSRQMDTTPDATADTKSADPGFGLNGTYAVKQAGQVGSKVRTFEEPLDDEIPF